MKTLKTICVIFLVVMSHQVITNRLHAQSLDFIDDLSISPIAGFNIALPGIEFDSLNGNVVNLDSSQLFYSGRRVRPGFYLGAKVRYPYSDKIEFISGLSLQYYQFKDINSIQYADDNVQFDQTLIVSKKTKLFFLELPIQAGYHIHPKLLLHGGFNLLFRVSAKRNYTDDYKTIINGEIDENGSIYTEGTTNLKSIVKGAALGFELGVSTPYKKWTIDINAKLLPNIFKSGTRSRKLWILGTGVSYTLSSPKEIQE